LQKILLDKYHLTRKIMTRQLCTLIIFVILLSCKHPEGEKYERNQGSKKKYESSNDKINVNAIQSETQNNASQKYRNVLEMEVQNGVRFVWIEINGIRLRFIFDTGASSISISNTEAMFLAKQGLLTKEDVKGSQSFSDANGDISEGTIINLKTVKIGNRVLHNIEASVVDNLNAPLLFGQSALGKFGKISIDNSRGEVTFE